MVDVVIFIILADIGLSFIGPDEHVASRQNSVVMELTGEFEPCLAKHLDEFGEKGSRKPS